MLDRVELLQLRYFVAVADTGSITQAANAAFITQPALSRHIKALEDEIGQPLFTRQAHSVHLTAAGAALLPDARALLAQADQVLARARTGDTTLRLRVGYAPSLAAGVLAEALGNFTQRHPKIQVQLSDLSTSAMLRGLRDDELDVALTVGQPRQTRGLVWTQLLRAPWRLAVSRRHRMAERAKVPASEVAAERLLVFCQRDYPEYWDVIAKWLRAHGQTPNFAGEYANTESLIAAVESGLGVACVTTEIARIAEPRVRLIALSSAPPPVCIALGVRQQAHMAEHVRVFVEDVRKAASACA